MKKETQSVPVCHSPTPIPSVALSSSEGQRHCCVPMRSLCYLQVHQALILMSRIWDWNVCDRGLAEVQLNITRKKYLNSIKEILQRKCPNNLCEQNGLKVFQKLQRHHFPTINMQAINNEFIKSERRSTSKPS